MTLKAQNHLGAFTPVPTIKIYICMRQGLVESRRAIHVVKQFLVFYYFYFLNVVNRISDDGR